MTEEFPQLQADVDALLNSFDTRYESKGYYLTDSGKQEIAKDMNTVHDGIAKITEKYLALKGTGVNRDKLLQAIENAKPLLSEKDLYTVESFTAFEAAYQEAEKALKDANSTQEDLDKAANALINAQTVSYTQDVYKRQMYM